MQIVWFSHSDIDFNHNFNKTTNPEKHLCNEYRGNKRKKEPCMIVSGLYMSCSQRALSFSSKETEEKQLHSIFLNIKIKIK